MIHVRHRPPDHERWQARLDAYVAANPELRDDPKRLAVVEDMLFGDSRGIVVMPAVSSGKTAIQKAVNYALTGETRFD